MKIEEIYALPMYGDGWRLLPNGNHLYLETNVTSQIDLAEIGSCAEIGSGAKILEKSVIVKSPLAVQGSKHLAGNYQPGMIQIGCQLHSFQHWSQHVEGIAKQHGYSKKEQAEYRRIVDFAVVIALLARSIWFQIKAHWAEQKRRDDAGEIPYVRDEERAKLIAQHPLLQMPSRKKVG